MSPFYKAITNDIEVIVKPEYMLGKDSITKRDGVFIWAYHIQIENKSEQTVQLLSRYWKIIDQKGIVQEVKGKGVIGKQPVLKPGSTFSYSSGVNLNYPSGIMSGHYVMVDEEGKWFTVKIPSFSLDANNVEITVN